jgi:TP901 family phage tail tape measure protein
LLLQNVGDVTADTANETLIAANAGFKLNGNYEKLAHTIDAMNNVSNNNATTVGKMSDAIKMAANVADTAGFSIDEFIAIIGTATAATQREGSEIGRAVRTIVANIRQIKDAEAEVDEDSFAKAGQALKNIAGISITMNGELRDTMDVLTELAGKWGTLDSIQKQQLATDLANKRQMDVFLGLMDNWTMVEKQLGEAVNSTGSALEENAIYTESITAKVNEFNNAVTKMWQDTIETESMKSFISFGTNFIDFINKLGLANVALTLTLAALSNKTSLIHKGFVALFTPLKELGSAMLSFVSATSTAMGKNEGLIQSLKNGKAAAQDTKASFSSLAGIIATVVVFALTQLAQAYDKAVKTAKELRTELEESYNNFTNNSEKIKETYNTYMELIEKQRRTSEESLLLKKSIDELSTSFEAQGIQIDNSFQYMMSLNDSTKDVTRAYNELNEAMKESFYTENIDKYNEAIKQSEMTYRTYMTSTETAWKKFGMLATPLASFFTKVDDISRGYRQTVISTIEPSYLLAGSMEEQASILADLIKRQRESNETWLSEKQAKNVRDEYKEISAILNELGIVTKTWDNVFNDLMITTQAEADKMNMVNKRLESYEGTLKTTTASTQEATKSTEELAEELAAAEEQAAKTKETFDNASSNALMLADAYYTVANKQQLNSKQISELLNKYPQLLQYYDANTNSLNINAQMIDLLINKELNLAKTTSVTSADRLNAILSTSSGALDAYKKQIQALQALSNAESFAASSIIYSETYASTLSRTGSGKTAVREATIAKRNLESNIRSYNAEIAQIAGLQSQLSSTKAYGTTSPNFEKIAKDASSSSSSASSEAQKAQEEAQKAQEEAQKRLLANTEARFELVRIAISNAYEKGAISAQVALARVNKEVNSIKGTYDTIKSKAENTWTDVEKLTVSHYENLLSMQKDYSAEVQRVYDDAVSAVESMQAKLVSAIRKKYEEEKSAAIKAIETQRTARQKAFDERIAQLEAEKAALQSTEKQDQANLKTLEKKLEMSRLDDSVLGKKRTAELQAEVNELRKNLQIAAIDKEIAKVKESAEASNQTYDEKIAKAEAYYEKLLSEANLYNEANKMLLSNNMNAIVELLKKYEPTFSGIGQLLGSSMAKEITAEVNKALASVNTVKSGIKVPSISYTPSSPSIVASAPTSPTAPAPVPAPVPAPSAPVSSGVPYPNTVFVRGSAGETVKRIQRNLVAKGYSVGSAGIDGKYGPATEAAVRAFQSKYGLVVDGKVGPQTWPKLVTFKSGGVPVLSGGSMTKGEGLALVHEY